MKLKLSVSVKKIKIHTPFIRLDAFLKLANAAASGGEAKQIISEEKIKVNGEICTMRGKKLIPGDRVTAGGKNYEVSSNEDNLHSL